MGSYLPDYCTRPPSFGRDTPKPPSPTVLRFRRIALAAMLRGQARRNAVGREREVEEDEDVTLPPTMRVTTLTAEEARTIKDILDDKDHPTHAGREMPVAEGL